MSPQEKKALEDGLSKIILKTGADKGESKNKLKKRLTKIHDIANDLICNL